MVCVSGRLWSVFARYQVVSFEVVITARDWTLFVDYL